MRKKILLVLIACTLSTTTMLAKDLRIVVFKVQQMMCENCEKKVKTNIRFEKGLKNMSTNLKEKTVTITYDPEKTTVEKLQDGFKKFKYEAVVVDDKLEKVKK